jgi:replication initiation protein RepC
MGNVETLVFPRRANLGLRKLTANHLVVARLAKQAPGLPEGVRHPNQLLAALRRAAPHLGQTRLLPLMEALFRWTQPQDWAAGAEPVVWPSNELLAQELACSERHVSRLIASAIEARLIAARDGTDRKRRGLRQDGHILWAWGLNLRPMAARHAEFVAAAEEGERRRQQVRALRRQATAARQFMAQLMALASARGLPLAPLEALYAEALRIIATLRRAEDPARLLSLAEAVEALAEQARGLLEAPVEHADMSGSPDLQVRPRIPTIQTPDSEKASVIAQEVAAVASPLQEPEAESCVSPAELLRLAPRLGACAAPGRQGWGEVSDAASVLARQLGIPRALYGEACRLLGRRPAAVAIALISARPPEHFHAGGPGGYLRAMLRRAEQGALFLDRSLHGLRDRARRARGQVLTAVNTGPGLYKMRSPGANGTSSASARTCHG